MAEISIIDGKNGGKIKMHANAFFIFCVRDNSVRVVRSTDIDSDSAELLCESMFMHAEKLEATLPEAVIDAMWENSGKGPEDLAHWLNGIFNLHETGVSPHEP